MPERQRQRYSILIAHNQYRQRGGEDAVVEAEVALLRGHGHSVRLYARHNDEIGPGNAVNAALGTVWSRRTVREVSAMLADSAVDVVHAHNTFPLISPSLYWNAARAGVPVVQTLHNFRLSCPQGMYLRDGRICEDCMGRVPWRGVVHRCYRQSVSQSGVLAAMLTAHRAMGTWQQKVTRYIALNEFCRRKFIQGGLPADRIVVKPNFVVSPASLAGSAGAPPSRRGGLYVGRLSPEKGISVLLAALDMRPGQQIDLVGDGPELSKIQKHPAARSLGVLNQEEVMHRMQSAVYLVMPSLWYENFPRTLVEAYSCGLPVIASRLGALAELVEEGRTGLLFEAGNAAELAEKIAWAESNPDAMRKMGDAARALYEKEYTPERNYEQLMAIYEQACAAGKGRG